MGDGGGSDAPLGANDRDHPPERLGARDAEQLGYRLDEVHHAKRGHQIFADATRDQLPVEDDVVELAENDDLGPCVAIFGELLQLREQRVATRRSLENDNIRRRRTLVSLDRSGRARPCSA